MDKYIKKTSFCQFFEPVSFPYLPAELQHQINQANAYVKKFDFPSFLKLMILSVAGQKANLRDIEDHLFNPGLQRELGFESLSISQISRALRRYDTSIMEGIFSYLISLIHLEERGARWLKACIIDATTFSLNKTRYP